MKVRVVMDVTVRGTREDVHPNFAARVIEMGLRKFANTSDLVVSWETIEASEMGDHAIR